VKDCAHGSANLGCGPPFPSAARSFLFLVCQCPLLLTSFPIKGGTLRTLSTLRGFRVSFCGPPFEFLAVCPSEDPPPNVFVPSAKVVSVQDPMSTQFPLSLIPASLL